MIAFTGGRPGMISAATAAVAVLVVPLVRGLNRASADLVDKFTLTDKTGVEIGLAPHP